MVVRKHAVRREWPAYVAGGPLLFFSGQHGVHRGAKGYCTSFEDVAGFGPGAGSRFAWVKRMEGPVGAQATAIYERYRELLAAEGGDFANLVRYHILQRDKRFFPVFDRIRRQYETAPPASTAVGVGRFEPRDAARLCVDAIAMRPTATETLGLRAVLPGSSRYAAAAHFSHVIGAGPYLFIAGQIPIDTSQPGAPLIRNYDDVPEEGRFLKVGRSHEDARNGPIAAQTWFTYNLIRRHLEAEGSSLGEILNLTVYLQDMRDFPTFHRVHERFFPSSPPALTVVEVSEVGHKGTLIEIEPTAILPGRGIERAVHAPQVWEAAAQMSPLVEAGGVAFLSGIAGLDADGAPVDSVTALPATLRRSLAGRQALARNPVALQLAAILGELAVRVKATGHDLERVTHLTVFIDDIEAFRPLETLFARAFGRWRPALTVIESPRPAPVIGARIAVTAIAWLGADAPIAARR
jgi:enamine deaminase RidA (YjgF/YER057c/UK114 family)